MATEFTFGVAGTGVIGAGWATRALSRGWDVVAWDPAPGAEDRLRAAIDRAWPSVQRLGLFPGADPGRFTMVDTLEELCAQADFIQESAPERLDLKQSLLSQLDAAAPPSTIIASSTSGLLPSDLQKQCATGQRVVVGHPFNPVYLLPLVEVVGGSQTSEETIERAIAIYDDLTMHPLHVRNEIEGHLSDRLQEALWREVLHIVADGIATTEELDDAITYGPGLRWAGMGTNLTFHLAGGNDGMRHMLKQFGPALELPWTKLKAPELTEELIDRMVEGTEAQADGRSIAELERLRDDYLLAVMQALRKFRLGAGNIIQTREDRRYGADAEVWTPETKVAAPLALFETLVDPEWVDYNAHMGESFFLLAFGWASDALFRYIGIDDAYRAAGQSFFTAETHINYYREVSVSEPLRFTTQVLDADHKRLHFFHTMYHGISGDVLAVTEQMLIHVNNGSSHAIPEPQMAALTAVQEAHAGLPIPDEVGHKMQIRR